MAFGHEKLDVYRAAIEYVGWAYRFCEALAGHRNAKDQLLRASQATPLNIAEGNAKMQRPSRGKVMTRILRSSTLLLMLTVPILGATDVKQGKPKTTELGPGDHLLTLKVGELNRSYIVHVPLGYDGRTPVSVVIMFHGGGGTAQGAMRETGWAQKADKEGFIAVFPEATPPDPSKPSRFGSNGQAWNDGSGGFHSGERNIPDVAFISAMIDDLIARFAADRRRIYGTGFSNGASMAFRVGIDLSDRIAAIAPVAGTLWIKQPKLDWPVSLFYVSGDADPLNPIEGGTPKMASGAAIRTAISRLKPPANEFVAAWARALGCSTEPKPVPGSPGLTTVIYSHGSDAAEVRFTIIQGHGHIWPGGKNLLPEAMVGKPSDKFKATDAIWEFFKRH